MIAAAIQSGERNRRDFEILIGAELCDEVIDLWAWNFYEDLQHSEPYCRLRGLGVPTQIGHDPGGELGTFAFLRSFVDKSGERFGGFDVLGPIHRDFEQI